MGIFSASSSSSSLMKRKLCPQKSCSFPFRPPDGATETRADFWKLPTTSVSSVHLGVLLLSSAAQFYVIMTSPDHLREDTRWRQTGRQTDSVPRVQLFISGCVLQERLDPHLDPLPRSPGPPRGAESDEVYEALDQNIVCQCGDGGPWGSQDLVHVIRLLSVCFEVSVQCFIFF